MIELSAREWRQIWEQLYNSGEINLSGRLSHDLGHAWNSDEWDSKFSLDFDDKERNQIRQAAQKAGVRIHR